LHVPNKRRYEPYFGKEKLKYLVRRGESKEEDLVCVPRGTAVGLTCCCLPCMWGKRFEEDLGSKKWYVCCCCCTGLFLGPFSALAGGLYLAITACIR
jgi:hypothetical protein